MRAYPVMPPLVLYRQRTHLTIEGTAVTGYDNATLSYRLAMTLKNKFAFFSAER
ncbi:hypothetical protein ACFPCW_16950 [Vibrio thalassae]|uniref:hypothetical protein n=1 Tax=Vibrio thalassae TaxID=1243014 RepID=UPI0036080446